MAGLFQGVRDQALILFTPIVMIRVGCGLARQGDTVSSLIGARSTSNAVVNNSGLHGTREVSGTIDLVTGKLYPYPYLFW